MNADFPYKAVLLIRRWEPNRFKKFEAGGVIHDTYTHLASLFGYPSWQRFALDYARNRNELVSKIETLLGPHGYAYYRALLVRRGDVS